MGINSCSRTDCNNIMLSDDFYDSNIGFVCSDCIQEFKKYLENNNLEPKTKFEISEALKIFIETSKGKDVEMSVDDFFGLESFER